MQVKKFVVVVAVVVIVVAVVLSADRSPLPAADAAPAVDIS